MIYIVKKSTNLEFIYIKFSINTEYILVDLSIVFQIVFNDTKRSLKKQ